MSALTSELKGQIESVKGIRKIAYAMQNVAASKMKRANQQMAASRDYSCQLLKLLRRVASAEGAEGNPYLRRAEGAPKRVAIIILGSDRGLCGSLNANLFRLIDQQIAYYHEQGIATFWDAIGARALEFCQKRQLTLLAKMQQVGDCPLQSALVQNVRVLLNYYRTAKLDGLLVARNRFVNNLIRTPVIEPILPLTMKFSDQSAEPCVKRDAKLAASLDFEQISEPETEQASKPRNLPHYDYLYEPDRENALNYLAVKYVETLVYQAVVDNIACEQVARMMAMRAAADNSAHIIQELHQQYHKERQIAITGELSDIIGGAEGLVA